MALQKIYIVRDPTSNGYEEESYWSTLKLAQHALAKYRREKLVSDKAEIVVVGLNIDGFTKPVKER